MLLALGRCPEDAKGLNGEPGPGGLSPPPAPCLLFWAACFLPDRSPHFAMRVGG